MPPRGHPRGGVQLAGRKEGAAASADTPGRCQSRQAAGGGRPPGQPPGGSGDVQEPPLQAGGQDRHAAGPGRPVLRVIPARKDARV